MSGAPLPFYFHPIDSCECGSGIEAFSLLFDPSTGFPAEIRNVLIEPCRHQLSVERFLLGFVRQRGWSGEIRAAHSRRLLLKDFLTDRVCADCERVILAPPDGETVNLLVFRPCSCVLRKLVGKMKVEEAKERMVCRICEQSIPRDGHSRGWMENLPFSGTDPRIVLDYGAEFAHASCIEKDVAAL